MIEFFRKWFSFKKPKKFLIYKSNDNKINSIDLKLDECDEKSNLLLWLELNQKVNILSKKIKTENTPDIKSTLEDILKITLCWIKSK